MNFQADYNLKVSVNMGLLGTCCHASSLPHLINLSMTRRYMRYFAVSLVLSQSFVNGHLTSILFYYTPINLITLAISGKCCILLRNKGRLTRSKH